jgi:phage repressor protein C with HTH and peptisase S24 domain
MAKSPLARELERRMDAAGLTQKALALKAGLNETAVRDIRTGKSRHPRHDTVQKLAAVLGISAAELIEPKVAAAARGAAREGPLATPGGELVFVPVYDIAAAAGHGTLIDADAESGRLAFRAAWLREVTNATPDELAVVTVRGDSMFPTLVDGDTVLVDRTQRAIRRDGIYVIRYDNYVLIKRLQIDPARAKVIVSCDNRDYPPLPPVDAKEIDVAGRVIWVGRRV